MQNIPRKQVPKGEVYPLNDKMELREMEDRLIPEEGNSATSKYGSTNDGFQDPTAPVGGSQSPSSSFQHAPPSADEKAPFPPQEKSEDRETWDSKLQFILATIGYAVGLGNVWRFPYLAQKNGGGAFLIPYFIMLIIEGIPVFYLELAVGQRLRKGAIGAWNLVSPYAGGIGITSAVASFNVALYYNTIIAWCLYYFSQSLQSPLPWADCPKLYFSNGSFINEPECEKSSPTQYFWYRTTLDISDSIENPERFNWKIALCLSASWLLCYLCMSKGIVSSGKVVYVTSTFPYLVLIIFFFRGITLEGVKPGLLHLFTPKWEKLADPVVWLEAGTQIFFSLGLAFGGLIAFASYNPVHNDCFRDAILVSLTNCGTSMFAGIVVFSVLGYKAHITHEHCLETQKSILRQLNLPISLLSTSTVGYGASETSTFLPFNIPKCDINEELEKSASGTGLAFIAFTEAVNQFPGAPLWSVLFFLMLFTLGIDSQFGTLEGVITSVADMKLFPNLRKELLTGGICLVSFFLSLIFAHGAGNYVFTLFDDFSGNFPLLIVAFFECVSISYIYGINRFSNDIELMTGRRPGLYWQFCWRYVAPATMIIILVSSFVKIGSGASVYEAWNKELATTVFLEWPTWARILAGILILMAAVWIPLVAILHACRIDILPTETESWFPAEELRDFYSIPPHKMSRLEHILFCIPEEPME